VKIVIKISGKNIDPENDHISAPLARLWREGKQLVIVHGGGPQITSLMNRVGKEARFEEGLRVTDREDMDLTEMVLSGYLNKTMVGLLAREGVLACGISGRDGGLIGAEKMLMEKEGETIDLGRVGSISRVDTALLQGLWDKGFLPVVSPVSADSEGRSLNVNADSVAAGIARAVAAETLVLFTDVPGVLSDPLNPESMIHTLSAGDIPGLLKGGVAGGGMIPKLKMAKEAVENGVREVIIAGGEALGALEGYARGGELPGTRVTA